MYITTVASPSRRGNKTYYSTLLRQSYREDGQVKTRTIANLTRCNSAELDVIRLALAYQDNPEALQDSAGLNVRLIQGKSFGAVWVLAELARRLGITAALGRSHQGKLALWQVLARVMDQGSRLSAVRLARQQAVAESFGLTGTFNEDSLYANLRYLAKQQDKIESRLWQQRDQSSTLFLYDVTSTYLEGEQNELAALGYNRDRKKGKRQLVVGLLCDETGEPVAVECFSGNTSDPATLAAQVTKVKRRFNCQRVTFVGDKGMIKSGQIEQLSRHGFSYLTSLTRPQIRTLLKQGTIQLSLFDDAVVEVTDQGRRYVLRRNPVRAQELSRTRADKEAALQRLVDRANQYLTGHPRAKPATQLTRLRQRAARLALSYVSIVNDDRQLMMIVDEAKQQAATELDGCYVVTTNVSAADADAQTVHDRYRDLKHVEAAFRTMKTTHLEVRPVYVRREDSTRGHLLVVMLAYRLTRQLQQAWRHLDITVPEGIDRLRELCAIEMTVGNASCLRLPQPRQDVQAMLDALGVKLPAVLPKGRVGTKRKVAKQAK